jgi:hypothetical protein
MTEFACSVVAWGGMLRCSAAKQGRSVHAACLSESGAMEGHNSNGRKSG